MPKIILLISIVFWLSNTDSSAQSKLCFPQIDSIVSHILDTSCVIIDTADSEAFPKFFHRSCYWADSNNNMQGIFTSAWTKYPTRTFNIDFFFYKKRLIRVDIFDFRGYKKINQTVYYYTDTTCIPFKISESDENKKAFYFGLATLYQRTFEAVLLTRKQQLSSGSGRR